MTKGRDIRFLAVAAMVVAAIFALIKALLKNRAWGVY